MPPSRHSALPRHTAVLHVIPHLMRCTTSYRATTRRSGYTALRRGTSRHSALDAESRNTGKGNTHKRHFSGPRIVVRGDPVRRGIQKYSGREYRQRHLPFAAPPLDPASLCGVTRCDAESRNTHHVIPRYDAVSRKYGQGKYPPVGPLNGTVPIDNHRLRLEYIRELHQSPPTSPSTAGFPVR